MGRSIYELQGYAIVLDKIQFVTRVFAAPKDDTGQDQGFRFNIRFGDEVRLAPTFPTRHEAELARELLLKALRGD